MTEILLLGTFHFRESSIDFYSCEAQKQLDFLIQKLLEFKPDAIAVELAVHQQKMVSKSYQALSLSDLTNINMRNNEYLDEICMFGETHRITCDNETVQVGYKMGKLLQLDDINAIDIDMNLGNNLEKVVPFLQDTIQTIEAQISLHQKDSILDMYKYYNSVEFSELNHDIYIKGNAIKIDGDYVGSELVTKWYERNLKIFSNIQQLAIKSKRLFIIYGAGHLKILKQLIDADSNLKLVDVYQYL